MRASTLQLLAFAATALAQTPGFDALTSPPNQANYKIGDTLPIAWTPSAPAGKITLTLIGGPSANALAPITVIAASIDSTLATFSWPIPSSVGSLASYGVNLTLDGSSDFQYSNQFFITGGSSSSSSSSSSLSTTESTTTVLSTTQSTATITVSSSSSGASSTPTTSVAVLTSSSASASGNLSVGATKTSSSSGKGGASVTGSTTGSASASSTPGSGAGALELGTGALVGVAGVVMAMLL